MVVVGVYLSSAVDFTRDLMFQRRERSRLGAFATVDAVEIHTQVGRFSEFERLWKAITPLGQST